MENVALYHYDLNKPFLDQIPAELINLTKSGNKVLEIRLSSDLWLHFSHSGDPDFVNRFDPYVTVTFLEAGSVGMMLGVELTCDAFVPKGTLRMRNIPNTYYLIFFESVSGAFAPTVGSDQTTATNPDLIDLAKQSVGQP